MSHKSDIVDFLRKNIELKKVNFQFGGYRVYPTGYSADVAELIDKEFVEISVNYLWKVAASYFMGSNKMIIQNTFNIADDNDLSYLVHESTHALLDYQKVGPGSRFDHEAIGYLAEAVWREARGLGSMGGTSIRTVTHRIAPSILAGGYVVSPKDVADLVGAVKASPHYAGKSDSAYESDGFE